MKQQNNIYQRIARLLPALSFITTALLTSGCNNEEKPQVSFATQVAPVLATHCLSCHNLEGEGYKKSGLNMATYATLMKGTKYGPVVIPGNAVSSSLVILIDGKGDPAIKMPHGSLQLLPKEDRDAIKLWVNQGAKDN